MITIFVEGEQIPPQKIFVRKTAQFRDLAQYLILDPGTDLKRFRQKERYPNSSCLFLPLKEK